MKRILCLALCAVMAVAVSACNDNADSPTQPVTEAQATDAPAPTETDDGLSLKDFIAGFDTEPQIENQTIYADQHLSVMVNDIDYTAASGPQLRLTVNNSFDRDIIVQAPYVAVNGYMISAEMNIEISGGKSADGTLTLPYYYLAMSDVDSLNRIELTLRVAEAESYNPLFTSKLLSVKTAAAPEKNTGCDDSGQIAYDGNDIKVVIKGLNTDRGFSDGAQLIVYMYNGTDRSIDILTGTVRVNGYDLTSVMNRVILPEKHAVDAVTFYDLDMEEYNIVEIDSIEVSFEIKDAETWEDIASTDVIRITPERQV